MKLKKVFFDIISFGTPQAKVFNLSSILLILAVIPSKYIVYSPFKCVFKHFLLPLIFNGDCPTSGLFSGCKCPACGLTRAMSRLLHGDFLGAWNFNKLVFIVFITMVIIIIINLIISIKQYKDSGKIV